MMDARLKLHYGLRCYKAYKYTIKQRIDLGVSLLDQGRLLFTPRTEPIYVSFTKAYYVTTSKTDIRGYAKHVHKDRVDSVEYGQAPFTAYMLRK